MRVRTALLLAIVPGMIAAFCLGQDNQEEIHRAVLIANLRSNNPGKRYGAFEEVRANQAMLRDPNVQSALFDLLDRETRAFNAEVREWELAEHKNNEDGCNEGWAEFMGDLQGLIKSFINWHDPHQVCILAQAGNIPDLPDPHENAVLAQVALPCLQQLSKSDFYRDRMKAAPIFVALLASAKGSLDSNTAETMKQAVVLALHDKRTEVQWEAVDSLQNYGASDMIPALKELAESNPGAGATSDETAVRKRAAKAIAATQEREKQHQ
jgi:hypothetical protein